MSESKPTPPTPLPRRSSARSRKPIGNRWLLISVALHVIVVVALVYLTPIRQIIAEATQQQPELTMSSEQLQQVSASIVDINELEVRQRVYELSTALEMMDAFEAHRQQEFEVFEQDQKSRAAEDAKAAMQTAVEHMTAAQQALDAGDPGAANNAQQQATFAQEEAAQRLTLIEKLPVQEAIARQQTATQQLDEAIAKQTTYRHARHLAGETERDIDRANRDLGNAEHRLERAQGDVQSKQKKVREQEERLAEVHKKIEEDGKERERELARVQSHIDRESRNLESAEQRVAEEQQNVAEAQEKLAELTRQLEERTAKADAAQREATPANAVALATQRETMELLEAKTVEKTQPKPQQTASSAPADGTTENDPIDTTTAATPPRMLGEHHASYMALGGKDIPDMYAYARQLEQKVTESYKQIRAMELAALRDVTLDQAMKNTDVVQPMRADIDAELIRTKARTQSALEAQKEEVARTIRETQSMVELAQMLLMQLQEHGGSEGGQPMTLTIIREQQEQLQQQEEQASQDVSGSVVDLTDPEVLIPEPLIPDEVRPLPGRKLAADGTRAVDWMFVDSWYTIGPFPNPGRANINRKYPPETAVDLDASYLGKDDQVIRWQFVQSGHEGGMINPPNAEPYGIWYAYTELKFDQPTEAWIAMGSDDRGQLWINDQVVWISPEKHKPWRVGEALRRVRFPAGRSRVLFRVENGWRDMGFSLLIHAASAELAASE